MPEDILPLILNISSLEQTALIGNILGRMAEPGDVILLHGDLAAGKTTLTQAIAQGLEVPDQQYVTSPSFALMHEYDGIIPLFHMDCYRLSGEDDIEGAGLADYIGTNGLAVIEWPDRLGSLCPPVRLDLTIASSGDQARVFTFSPHGDSWKQRIQQLAAEINNNPVFYN